MTFLSSFQALNLNATSIAKEMQGIWIKLVDPRCRESRGRVGNLRTAVDVEVGVKPEVEPDQESKAEEKKGIRATWI